MHTVASNKLSGKERELAPRYYYKVSEKISFVQRLRGAIQIFLTFLFTQVGVIMLIGAYMVGGAFLFCELEQDSLQEQAITAENVDVKVNLNIFFINSSISDNSELHSPHLAAH